MSRSTEEQAGGAGRLWKPAGLSKRLNARRKAEVVLRLLRSEDHRRDEPGDSGCGVGIGPSLL